MISAEYGLDSGDHFFRIKWFHDIVIGSQFQTEHFVKDLALGGKHDDRCLRMSTDLTAYLITVNARKHQIQKYQIRIPRIKCEQSTFSVVNDLGVETFFC